MDNLIKVLICDDHAIFREGIKAALSTSKDILVIDEAENGMRLLQILKHVTPDIILLDINMPVMDGFATLPHLKKLYPNIKVIVLSWNDDMSWVEAMMNLGANSYLTKDDESKNIIEAIKTCQTREFYLNELTEKAIKRNLEKAPTIEIPITKFEQNKNEVETNDDAEEPKSLSIWKGLGKGLLYAALALLVLAGLYFVWVSLKDNLTFFENFTMPLNKNSEF